MAKPYVTGPCHLFLGVGPSGAAIYLGTAERTPEIQIRPSWSPVFNSIAGEVPFDWLFEGEEAFLTADLTRWNEPVYAASASRPNAGATRGRNIPGDLGTLMISEGFAYQLWALFPYSILKPAFSDQQQGFRFPAAFLEGPDSLSGLGTINRRNRLMFHAGRAYSINPSGLGMDFLCYDGDMSGLPPIN